MSVLFHFRLVAAGRKISLVGHCVCVWPNYYLTIGLCFNTSTHPHIHHKPIHSNIHPSELLSIHPPTSPSMRTPTHPPAHPSIHPFIYPSTNHLPVCSAWNILCSCRLYRVHFIRVAELRTHHLTGDSKSCKTMSLGYSSTTSQAPLRLPTFLSHGFFRSVFQLPMSIIYVTQRDWWHETRIWWDSSLIILSDQSCCTLERIENLFVVCIFLTRGLDTSLCVWWGRGYVYPCFSTCVPLHTDVPRV